MTLDANGTPGLKRLHVELSWPEPDVVLKPSNACAEMYVRLVREKIGASLKRLVGHEDGVEVGILLPDSNMVDTQAPLAIVCEFRRPASSEILQEAHRLAWNFCHAPILVTVDPFEIRTWSCFTAPVPLLGHKDSTGAEIRDVRGNVASDTPLYEQAAKSLHWLSLVSGRIISDNTASFDASGRADRMLLANLKVVRQKLLAGDSALEADLAHDLIARLMFIQFLFDRKDASGFSALDSKQLDALSQEGIFKREHRDLESILADYEDAYGLFRWLNTRFNGDFFPAKSQNPDENEREWSAEMHHVKPNHLKLLADLVGGKLVAQTGQLALWRMYAFDAIPLEFVSCIYEEFVSLPAQKVGVSKMKETTRLGTHYTPTYLVDFILDSVLPWDGKRWDLRILDPACGSGIFLVRSFQRLVHRWRRSHPGKSVPVDLLADLLNDKLFGIDINPHAARVASFSLYLAMCDEIDPRQYWNEVRFPSLRGYRIIASDFFIETKEGFSSKFDSENYDLVVGNAPWGKNTLTADAENWSTKYEWPIFNKDIGVLFLAKSLKLVMGGGQVAMIQSAGTLLFSKKSDRVRSHLFRDAQVSEIINYTILRFHLFPTANSPACSVTLTKQEPDGSSTSYICPKLLHTGEDQYRIVIDARDVHAIFPEEVQDPWIWIVLMAATRRDLDLLRRLRSAGSTLRDLKRSGDIKAQEGVIPDPDGGMHEDLIDRRVLLGRDFPENSWLRLKTNSLPKAKELHVHRKTNAAIFGLPQLLIKQSWQTETRRFRAMIVDSDEDDDKGVVCSQSFISVRGVTPLGEDTIKSACIALNSRLVGYYLSLTNSRLTYRVELQAEDFYDLPLPKAGVVKFKSMRTTSDIDRLTEKLFDLHDSEVALIEDAMAYSVPELIRDRSSPGRNATRRENSSEDPQQHGTLWAFCDQFLKVLQGNGDEDYLHYSATIFEGSNDVDMSLCLVAIHLGRVGKSRINIEDFSGSLSDVIETIGSRLKNRQNRPQILQNRIATVFDLVVDPVTQIEIPTIFLVKPDQIRFWTRATAMADADRIYAEGIQVAGFGNSDKLVNNLV